MNNKSILYIEDNYHNRRIVKKILSMRGHSVVEAEDGLKGYEKICKMKPPLVLLDISLPGIDGIEIVKRVKADEELKNIPVIALTASAMRGDRERFLAAGCDDYLSKPFPAMELLKIVDKYYHPASSIEISVFDQEGTIENDITIQEPQEVEIQSDDVIVRKLKERMKLGKIPPPFPTGEEDWWGFNDD